MEDVYFRNYLNGSTEHGDVFIILYFILLTSSGEQVDPELLKEKCLKAFAKAVNENDDCLLDVLKTLNLIFKKWPNLNVGDRLSLDHIYFCLQSNQLGMRDEMLTFLQNVCRCRVKSLDYFIRIVHFWPWTYRTKLYMLVSILNKNSLEGLLANSGYSGKEFFRGLRSTLCYKNLLPSSQHVIKALSSQRSKQLLDMCKEILINGSLQEIRNLHAQWFSRIQQKEELFLMVWNDMNMKSMLDQDAFTQHQDPVASYRFVLISYMFSKEIFHLSVESFKQITVEYLRNYCKYDLESQLVIYKFIVDNLMNLNIEDCLDFFLRFSRKHMTVENSQFRNTILGKMPTIINHIAKLFSKLSSDADVSDTGCIKMKILHYFQSMQKDIEEGIMKQIYQPKIFCLKLLELLLRSLYGTTVAKNAKNCCLKQNQNLAEFLKEQQVFNAVDVSSKLLTLLNDPTGFDDALDLIVVLIGMINQKPEQLLNQALDMTIKTCDLSDVDEANLSYLYARVAVGNCTDDDTLIFNLFQNIWGDLKARLSAFESDPLFVCKSKGWHLFSILNVINEIVQLKPKICLPFFENILKIVEEIEVIILKMLNICNNQNTEEIVAASFEDIDKSLEILVSDSKCPSDNHEISRKYLLMSFWLTLKACCDLAASMGTHIVTSNDEVASKLEFLQRCLQISVTVLTKCRHKGAIEAAGVTIGKLTKCITSKLPEQSDEYALLHKLLQQLYDNSGKREVSTTRRGAGFSIMFLHIVKNEELRSRPILRRVIRHLLILPKAGNEYSNSPTNCDRTEALHLHYLCVLVRDTELREAMSKYYNDIMMAAVTHIDNPEWTICNAALQLLGALVPKIVGQRQATEFDEALLWEPSEVTFCEVTRKLDMSYEYILNYCLGEKAATGSIILFLEFLHKVEYIHKEDMEAPKTVKEFRHLMWCLLCHPCEKVRKLSAKCFVRSHEFSHELPNALQGIAKIIFKVKNENFFEGLVHTLHQGILKLQHDFKHVITEEDLEELLNAIAVTLHQNFSLKYRYKYYTLCKLWDLLQLLNSVEIMEELRTIAFNEIDYPIAYDLWLQRVQ